MASAMYLKGVDEATRVLEDFARKLLPRQMKDFGDALSLDLGGRIIEATPVRGANTRPSRRKKGNRGALQEGGRARGGWQGQVGATGADGDLGEGVKDKVGTRTKNKGASRLPARRYYEPFTWSNNVPYILILEEGRVEGPPARGSLQAPEGMVTKAVEALKIVKASEILGRDIVISI